MTRSERLKRNYNILRELGFSSKEAIKYRTKSSDELAVYIKEKSNAQIKIVREKLVEVTKDFLSEEEAKKLSKKSKKSFQSELKEAKQKVVKTPKPRGIQYTDVKKAKYRYLSKYTVIVKYNVNVDGKKQEFFVTVTGMGKQKKNGLDKYTKKEIIETAKNYVSDGIQEGVNKYPNGINEIVLWSSFEVFEAFVNTEL